MIAKEILDVLPPTIRAAVKDLRGVQELRLRLGQPIAVRRGSREEPLPLCGVCRQEDLDYVLLAATGQSIYSAQETLKQGYINLHGNRIGICGTCVVQQGRTSGMRAVTSMNLRVAQDIPIPLPNAARMLSESLLIVGPPGSGKTTLLRACIRALSERGKCVSVVDERGEIGAFALGQHVDVLRGSGKQEGMEMLLRTMTPEWIAVDEISSENDVITIEKCSHCGAKILATAHADGVEEMKKRRVYRSLLESGAFRHMLILDKNQTFSEEWMPC